MVLFNEIGMHQNFEKNILTSNGCQLFEFESVFYGADLYYHVKVGNGDNRITFRMKRNKENMWGIIDENLPGWIFENVLQYNDAINNN